MFSQQIHSEAFKTFLLLLQANIHDFFEGGSAKDEILVN